MIYEEYKEIISKVNTYLKFNITDEQAFRTHFLLISLRITEKEELSRCLFEHLKSSDKFPSHIDLFKHLQPEFPDYDAKSILMEIDDKHKKMKYLLMDKYGLSFPRKGTYDFQAMLTTQEEKFVFQIDRNLSKLKKSYDSFETTPKDIFIDNNKRIE